MPEQQSIPLFHHPSLKTRMTQQSSVVVGTELPSLLKSVVITNLRS
jgi:hypothetical protein